MAKTKISEFSSTAADNTDITNINIAEGCSPAKAKSVAYCANPLKSSGITEKGTSFISLYASSTSLSFADAVLRKSSARAEPCS